MTKYHVFGRGQYDESSAISQYVGVFDSPVDAYTGLVEFGADYGELAIINDSGELERIGKASTGDPLNVVRNDTSVTWEYGWTIEGKSVIAKTETVEYKATKSQIEAAAREFAEEHQVTLLGIDEYANPNSRLFYITVRFDWDNKHDESWKKEDFKHFVVRVPREKVYQWEFDDRDRIHRTATQLIADTAGKKLQEDRLSPEQWAKMEASRNYVTGM